MRFWWVSCQVHAACYSTSRLLLECLSAAHHCSSSSEHIIQEHVEECCCERVRTSSARGCAVRVYSCDALHVSSVAASRSGVQRPRPVGPRDRGVHSCTHLAASQLPARRSIRGHTACVRDTALLPQCDSACHHPEVSPPTEGARVVTSVLLQRKVMYHLDGSMHILLLYSLVG